ncbi:MAG: hypothetical protein JKX81_10740 [Arenicella sp.]|nr:hypothetical protein [Arenicella sp.]
MSSSATKPEQTVGVEQKNTRRTVLRNTLIGGGAVISTSFVPDKWKKPLLDSVILPSHAQTSTSLIVMGGGSGISITKADNNGFGVDDILDVFIGQAYADVATSLNGGCLLLTIEGSVATVSLTLNDNQVDTKTGTVDGTAVSVSGLHSGYTVTANLDSASTPTSATGSVSGFGETGAFAVSSADPVCAPVATTTPVPTTTPSVTTTPVPTTTPAVTTTLPPNSNVTFNFSLSKSSWS